MASFGKGIPDQIKRLSVVVILVLAAFFIGRMLLIPRDFGRYDHFRASALFDVASQEVEFAGQDICTECHDDISSQKANGYHQGLSCETCHGPAAKHTESPDEVTPFKPSGREYCPICHAYLASRPTGFPMIIVESHNPMKACTVCHNPHDPKPPQIPRGCEACHAEIARTKAVSHHVYIPCTRCHQTPEEHKVNPRTYRPDKPKTREFCGACHAEGSTEAPEAIKIDISTHGGRYVCWQCHYPHLPEAR